MASLGDDVFEDFAAVAIDAKMPAIRLVRLVPQLAADPKRAVAKRHCGHLAEMVPFAEILAVQVEPLQQFVTQWPSTRV